MGKYQLLRLLAVGGMGEVFLARQISSIEGFARLAAVKVLMPHLSSNPTFIQMFLEEARIAARLRHPNLVSTFDVDQDGGTYFMAMEYVPGQNLRELLGDTTLAGRSLLPARLVAGMFAEIADALALAHREGLVHRDISPNNIMISDTGAPKLIDFGVARAMEGVSLTTPGTLKGKWGYMAPEYVRGGGYDHRADLFSLGVVMWETLARRRLFKGQGPAAQLNAVLATEIPRVDSVNPEVSPVLGAIVERLLERDPERRYARAEDVTSELLAVQPLLDVSPDAATLGQWIRKHLGARVDARTKRDQELLSLPPDQPPPELEFPAEAHHVGSVPGTYGLANRPVEHVQSATSMRYAASEQVSSSQVSAAQAAPAPSPWARRLPWIAVALTVLTAGTWILVARSASTTQPEPAAATAALTGPADASLSLPPSPSAIAEAAEHRKRAVDAITRGDLAAARKEILAGIVLVGQTQELADLNALVAQAEVDDREARARAPEPPPPTPIAAAEPPAPGPGPRPTRRTPAKVPARTAKLQAAPAPATETPKVVAPAEGHVTITSSPSRLTIVVDGTAVGTTPKRHALAPGDHQLTLMDGTRVVATKRLSLAAGATEGWDVSAPPPPAATPTRPAPPPVAPPPPAVPRTPRVAAGVSGDPNVGRGLVASRCNGCHTSTGIGAVSGRAFASSQWRSFFASGRHDHYQRLGDKVSAAELAAIKAHLIANAADAAEDQGAGVRE